MESHPPAISSGHLSGGLPGGGVAVGATSGGTAVTGEHKAGLPAALIPYTQPSTGECKHSGTATRAETDPVLLLHAWPAGQGRRWWSGQLVPSSPLSGI